MLSPSRGGARPGRGGKALASVALLILLVGIRAAANATPPPPLWIAGWYDAANFDDAAQFLFSVKGLPTETSAAVGRPELLPPVRTVVSDSILRLAPACGVPQPRAPPLPH